MRVKNTTQTPFVAPARPRVRHQGRVPAAAQPQLAVQPPRSQPMSARDLRAIARGERRETQAAVAAVAQALLDPHAAAAPSTALVPVAQALLDPHAAAAPSTAATEALATQEEGRVSSPACELPGKERRQFPSYVTVKRHLETHVRTEQTVVVTEGIHENVARLVADQHHTIDEMADIMHRLLDEQNARLQLSSAQLMVVKADLVVALIQCVHPGESPSSS